MKSSAKLSAVALMLAVTFGCETPSLPTGPQTDATPAETKPAEPERPMVAGAPGKPLPPVAIPVTSTPRPVDPDDPIKGRRSKRAGGGMGAAAHARFWAEHKLIYDQVKSNLMLYMSTTGKLEYPKSNEEFFEKVIEGYQMKLPELEPHHEYIYVPEQPELGLQIRLKPGFAQDGTPLPGGAATEAEAASATETQPETSGVEADAEPQNEEPSPDIRTRAGQLGEKRNEQLEKHDLAPGGLAPVGGLDEGEF